MSPQLTLQGMVLATTAAMAVSGAVVLIALRLHHRILPSPEVLPRPCISSSSSSSSDERGRSRGVNKSKKKKVRFANDAADPGMVVNSSLTPVDDNSEGDGSGGDLATSSGDKVRGIQANRMALYNGILRDRVLQRMAYSY